VRRRLITLADQAVFSLSNIVVALLVARSFDTAKPFGAFSVAMLGYQLIVGGVRSLVGEPLLSSHSHETPEHRRRLMADLLGATFMLGVLCSLVIGAISVWVGGMAGAALLGLAFVLPLLTVQDALRYAFIVDRAGAALLIDVVWLVVVVVAVPLAPADASVQWFVVVWGLGGALGAVVGVLLSPEVFRRRPRPVGWLVEHKAVGSRFFGEFVTALGLSQVLLTAFGAISGLAALGGVRGSQLFYGPINTAYAGVYLVVVPEGAQMRDSPARLRRIVAYASGGLMSLAALWMLVGIALPDSLGREILGGAWPRAERLMLPMGAFAIAGSAASGGLYGLRALADAKRSLRTRLRCAPIYVAFPLVGTALGGAVGFATGLAIGASINAVMWWQAFLASLSDRARGLEPPASELEVDEVVEIVEVAASP
jgi:hypothetical protein